MIIIGGDPHGNFKPLLQAIKNHKPTAVLLVGDIEAEKNLDEIFPEDTNLWWIHGNHEFENEQMMNNLIESRWGGNNLHNRVIEIDGQRIAGIGGTFNKNLWMPPEMPIHENYKSWEAANLNDKYFHTKKKDAEGAIYYDDYINMMTMSADILITHEAPTCHPYGHEAIDELAQAMGIKRLFHGHHHDNLDYTEEYDRMGFIVNGVGLAGVSNVHGEVLIKGLMDDERNMKRSQRMKMYI